MMRDRASRLVGVAGVPSYMKDITTTWPHGKGMELVDMQTSMKRWCERNRLETDIDSKVFRVVYREIQEVGKVDAKENKNCSFNAVSRTS